MATEEVDTGNQQLDNKVKEWLNWDKNDKTCSEIRALVKKSDVAKLEKLLLSRLAFGTAGLRGRMGPGYSQMNDLVIIQTGQGLLHYMEKVNPNVKQQGLVIGYDARHNSERWAKMTAAIFLNRGIPVYLFSKLCPTPFVPYAVLEFGCSAGVMVTASHNPKDDNGYKVYWSNGVQIVSPHDKGIQAGILENLCPLETSWDTSIIHSGTFLKDPLDHVMKTYYDALQKEMLDLKLNGNSPLKITFTPMHGVAQAYMVEAFSVCNFKPFVSVEEQKEPDPDFPTVKFPNPEEGKSALDLSMKTADENNSTLILANDPDADRLGVAEKQRDGTWKLFTGNEIGSLLSWSTFHTFQKKNPEVPLSDVYIIASTVSTKMSRAVTQKEGFNFMETLTGFKWIGNKACELLKEGKKVVLAFEEALGYMCGTVVLDKDGISAAMKVAELAAYLQTLGMTLKDKLHDMYKTYGYHVCNNSYYLCYDPATVKRIFERLRNYQGTPGTYPKSILNGKYELKDVRDLTTGYDSSQPDKRALLPVSKSTQMITFTFQNGSVATIRTSGTEPKIKYYTEYCGKPEQDNWSALDKTLDEMVAAIIEEFLQPAENGLIPRSN